MARDSIYLDKATRFGEYLTRQQQVLIFEQAEILAGRSVFEIGAGKGHIASFCKQGGYGYSAVDKDLTVVNFVNNHCGVVIREATVPPLPADVRDKDAIFALAMIEHLPGLKEVEQLFREVYIALKKGGKFIVAVPDLLHFKWDFWDAGWEHNFPTTKRRMIHLFGNAGFRIIKVRYFNLIAWGAFASVISWVVSKFGWTRDWNKRIRKARYGLLREIYIVGEKV